MSKQKQIKPAIACGDKTILPEGAKKIPLIIMGKEYMIPETLTVMKAIEFTGHQYTRGCGCRGGICGACGFFYRFEGDYKLKTGLACQTVAEPNMIITQLPFFPMKRSMYDIEAVDGTPDEMLRTHYPEVFKCVGCGTCTRTCPMEIDVMGYVAAMKQGNVTKAAHKSFDCIMCGLCASRCPAQISQPNAALMARRLHAKVLTPEAQHMKGRVEDVNNDKYVPMLEELAAMDQAELKTLYMEREREPDLSKPGEWMPKDETKL
ncbi:MAG: 4Fe-4S dicluster domain-containing protein [bacterium]|nr:4Fe-4S dicluster domain-containing protein [bacterium]